jgi:hypothetical protein
VSAVGRAGWFALILVVAIALRLDRLDAYVTIDESRWIQRSGDFYALIQQRDFEDTFIIGHPGVTTMWTALLGMGRETALKFSFREGRADATRRDGYLAALVAARVPFALLGAAGAVIVGLLAWRLAGFVVGILTALLAATEPFLIAHSRVVHLDSGVTVYSSIGVLFAIIACQRGGVMWALLSGVACGLAFLTKAPSIYVLAFVPALGAWTWWRGRRDWRSVVLLAAWAASGLATCLLLWPALRVDLIGTLLKMAQFTSRVGGGDHDNFFFGVVTDDPGPFFYPVALAYRLGIGTLGGLSLAALFSRRLGGSRRALLSVLGVYVMGFGLMMMIGSKKFDRYLLPIFPLLCLGAAVGYVAASEWLASRGWRPVGSVIVGLVIIAGLQLGPLVPIYPHHLAYFSPVLGGGDLAQRAILVGWGEGLAEMAGYINAQPTPLGAPTVASSYHRVLQAHLAGSAVPLERERLADYVVPYVNTMQRADEQDVLGKYLAGPPPSSSIRIGGIEYARVYRGPRYPLQQPFDLRLANGAALRELVLAPGSGRVRPGEEVMVMLRWEPTGSGNPRAVVALVAADGQRIVESAAAVGADGPDARGLVGETHRLTVPQRQRPGELVVALSVVELATGIATGPIDLHRVVVE